MPAPKPSESSESSEARAPNPGLPPPLPLGELGLEASPELKAPEIERSLDRAKENLIAYVQERHPEADVALLRKAIDFTVLALTGQPATSAPLFASDIAWTS